MAIGIIATLKVQDGKDREFETIFAGLAKAVRANEPGNSVYQLCRSRKDAATYIVMEIYESEDALKAHRESEHFKAAGPGLGTVLAGRPEIALFDVV